jgi:cytochrome c biogenesis protein
MRTALMLLMLLSIVAVPGSVLPQRPQNPAAVVRYMQENPGIAPWMDRLGFFDVYASPWFSAVYLLLFTSLVGCIVPRIRVHLSALRSRPPRAPRRFERFADQARVATSATQEAAIVAARAVLVGRWRWLPRFRVEPAVEADGAQTLAAERGYLRETGNLLFHAALLGLLVAVAVGQLVYYRGQVLVVEGKGFGNTQSSYDTFEAGAAFDPATLVPFTLTLDTFQARFDEKGVPFFFQADVTVTPAGGVPEQATLRVNRPLVAGGAKVYLAGNGYAPQVTVRDGDGNVAFAGPVPFLPQDGTYRSQGVIKVPDVTSGDQIGLVGTLLPTAVVTADGAYSAHPQPGNPLIVLQVWRGDLGLDSGVPQNVYNLDTTDMTRVVDAAGAPATIAVRPGESVDLPDGLGTLTFDGLRRFAAFDIRRDPSLGWVLGFALAALLGLSLSLFTPRRRLWVRVRVAPGPGGAGETGETGETGVGPRTLVEVAALARTYDVGLAAELDRVLDAVRALDRTTEGRPA